MMNFGGFGTTFADNLVGIYINYSSQYAGMDTLNGYTFRNNGTAIKIDNLDIGALGNKSMNALSVMGSKFINNTVDVENNAAIATAFLTALLPTAASPGNSW